MLNHQVKYVEKLAVGHCNIQGGLTGISKCLDLQNLLIKEKLDVLCLNETNLKSDIDTNSLDLPSNFTFLRKDRVSDNGHGGGGVLVSSNIKHKTLTRRYVTRYVIDHVIESLS